MANMGTRQILRAEKIPEYNACGGFSNAVPKVDGKMYNGPAWFYGLYRGSLLKGVLYFVIPL